MLEPLAVYLGYAGATLTTCSFVPQLLRVWRSRSAHDISTGMYVMFIVGLLLWIIYGVWISSWPIVIANSVTALLALSILVLKAHFGRLGALRASAGERPSPKARPAKTQGY
ncbi:MAG TPA: SemiSWEET transporter [Steroidobacteraceae bacterium]